MTWAAIIDHRLILSWACLTTTITSINANTPQVSTRIEGVVDGFGSSPCTDIRLTGQLNQSVIKQYPGSDRFQADTSRQSELHTTAGRQLRPLLPPGMEGVVDNVISLNQNGAPHRCRQAALLRVLFFALNHNVGTTPLPLGCPFYSFFHTSTPQPVGSYVTGSLRPLSLQGLRV
eukprot:1349224-Amphidinium_carterae.1